MRLLDRELAAIAAREAAATPGPWRTGYPFWSCHRDHQHGDGSCVYDQLSWGDDDSDVSTESGELLITSPDNGPVVPGSDGIFIAHARTDIPALLAEVRRLRALLPEGA